MAETKRQTGERLRDRTLQLQKEHDSLEQPGKPFNQEEHERHREALHKHHKDLEEYRDMPDDPA
jgi:hypothetical protein